MTLREIILAFLAARYPAAFAADAITARVNASGLLDNQTSPSEVYSELKTLCRKFEYIDAESDTLTGNTAWSATTAGVREWHISGQLHVR